MKKLLFSAVVASVVFSSSPVYSGESMLITDPWVRETLPSMKMTAGYFQLNNTSSTTKTMIAAESSCANRVEIHEHKLVDGLMKMQKVPALEVKENSVINFVPGGYHLMMFGVSKQVKQGNSCEMRLIFQDKSVVTFTAPVKSLVK